MGDAQATANRFTKFVTAVKDATPETGPLSDCGVSVEFYSDGKIVGAADFYDDGGMVFVESGEGD